MRLVPKVVPFVVIAALAATVHTAWQEGPGSKLAPGVDAVALGRAYAPVLAGTYADAWLAAADTLERGGSVAQSQKALQDAWTAARVRAFKARVAPAFSMVLPEGAEPADAAERLRVAATWRAFASGLRKAR